MILSTKFQPQVSHLYAEATLTPNLTDVQPYTNLEKRNVPQVVYNIVKPRI